ncbi:MAG: cadherin-like domain-containing protein, partial [Actinomycetota bacterium]
MNDAPTAVDRTHQVTGNVRIQVPDGPDDLLTGASDIEGDTLTAHLVTAGVAGSNVTINSDGTYSYNPKPGREADDAMIFEVCDNGVPVACSVDRTLTLDVANMIWFIDNSLGAPGDGRLTSPFNTLAAFAAVNNGTGDNPADNDHIFVERNAATAYTGGVTLRNGQKLFGNGASATLAVLTGITPAPHSDALPSTGGTAPLLTTSGGTVNAVTLGQNNTVRGISIGDTSGAGIAGSNFGTLTLSETAIGPLPRTGAALSLSTGTCACTLSNVSSSSSASAVALSSLAGTLTIEAGALSGASGAEFDMNLGTADVSFAGSITNGAGLAVEITNRTGGTASFTGPVSTTGSPGGVSLTSNTGSTTNFSGGVTLSTGSNAAFAATGGGTVIVTGSTNTLATTTGTALNVASTTIGASGLTFRSISAGTGASGPSSGIVLDTTGSSGGLTVAGTGTAGSGGTIQRTTGPGILLSNTRNVSLSSMVVQNGTDDGIRGTNVTGFTLAGSTVSGNGDVVGERGIEFTGLFGSPTISDSVVTGSAEDNLYVNNTSGTLTLLTVTGTPAASPSTCQFNNTSATVGNDGILFLGGGSANMAISVTNCSFSNSRGDHFQATNAAGATGTMDVVFQANELTGAAGNLGAGVTIFPSGGTTTFDVVGNDIQGAVFSAVMVNLNTSAPASSVLSGTVSGNTIGTAGTLDSGSVQGDGISVLSNGPGTTTVAITNNTIRQYSNLAGINIHQRDGDGTLN